MLVLLLSPDYQTRSTVYTNPEEMEIITLRHVFPAAEAVGYLAVLGAFSKRYLTKKQEAQVRI
jgi:hypothetical protein